ncbi:MAG: hypothetical protein PUD09_03390 [Coriobacteriales bacterium]|nr:hypothetical protein [Coriobacteriales bacterium]
MDAQLRYLHLQQTYCGAQVLSSYVDEIYHRVPVRADGKACISEHSYVLRVDAIDHVELCTKARACAAHGRIL